MIKVAVAKVLWKGADVMVVMVVIAAAAVIAILVATLRTTTKETDVVLMTRLWITSCAIEYLPFFVYVWVFRFVCRR